MSTQNAETTSIEQVEMNLDEILGTPGAENVMLPEEEKKPNMFSSANIDLSFIDKTDADNEGKDEDKDDTSIDDVISEVDPDGDFRKKEEADDKPKGGRPKVDKSGMAELVNKLIESGKLVPFDDDKSMDEYTIKDYEELLDANFAEIENKVRQETPAEFFESLPQELQYAAKYVADGGQDLKGLFQVLAQAEEVRDLDPTSERDQEQIIREYLRATSFGNSEEIEEEIDGWRDRGDLEAKANKFKPKLDKMQESVVAQKLAKQEQMKRQQQAASEAYMQNVYNTVAAADLNGIKLDKRSQNLIYTGLVQPSYPSISGKQTNLLGHLLEKYQYVEPNYPLIAEALWLLADPDGYRSKVKEQGKAAQVEKTVRQLKTEQAKLATSSPVVEKEETTQRRIPRNGNFFKR